MFDFTTLINDVIILAGVFGLNKTGLIKFVQKNEAAIVKGTEDVGHLLADVVQLPGAKLVEAELHHKVDELTKQFRESELGRLAAEALNYTEKDLAQLSDAQKQALLTRIDALLPKEWGFSFADIEKALVKAQKGGDETAADTMIQSADKYTQEVQSRQVAAQPEVTQVAQ